MPIPPHQQTSPTNLNYFCSMRTFWAHVDSFWPLNAGAGCGQLSRYYYEIRTDMCYYTLCTYVHSCGAPTAVIMWLTSLGKIRAATAHDYGTFRVTRAKLTALRPPVAETCQVGQIHLLYVYIHEHTYIYMYYIQGYYMCSSITKRASCFPASSRFRVRLISLRLGSCALNSNIRSNGRLAHSASNGERLPRRRPAHYTTAHRCGRFPYPIPPAKPFPIREGSSLQPGDTKHLGVLWGYTGLQRLDSWTTYFCTSTTEGISHSPL